MKCPVRFLRDIVGFIKIFHLILCQLDINAPKSLDHLLERIKVYQHISLHINAKILMNRLDQSLHATIMICRIDLIVRKARYLHIGITHDRGQTKCSVLPVNGCDHNAVGSSPTASDRLLAAHKDIDHILRLHYTVCTVEMNLIRIDRFQVFNSSILIKILFLCFLVIIVLYINLSIIVAKYTVSNT